MRKYLPIVLLVFLIFNVTTSVHAQDGFFSNARTFEQGTFAIGLQPVVLTSQDDMLFMGARRHLFL